MNNATVSVEKCKGKSDVLLGWGEFLHLDVCS